MIRPLQMAGALVAGLAILATSPASAAPFGKTPFGRGHYATTYKNTAGHIVLRPVLSAEKPAGATGRCADTYWTFSEDRSGACQGHGGVAIWLKN